MRLKGCSSYCDVLFSNFKLRFKWHMCIALNNDVLFVFHVSLSYINDVYLDRKIQRDYNHAFNAY